MPNIPSISRRRTLRGALLLAGAAAAGPPRQDHAILDAVAAFHAVDQRLRALANASDEALDACLDDWHTSMHAVIDLQSTSLAGIKAKATCLRPILHCLWGHIDEEFTANYQELSFALSLADDLDNYGVEA